MVFDALRIIKYFQPKVFIAENVKGLLSHNDGESLNVILAEMSDCGYAIDFEVWNTSWFLPQNRERVYIIGIRLDLCERLESGLYVRKCDKSEGPIADAIKKSCYQLDMFGHSPTERTEQYNDIVRHLRGTGGRKIFPIAEGDSGINQDGEDREGQAHCADIAWALRGRDYKDGTNFICLSDSAQGRKREERKILPPLRSHTGCGHDNYLKQIATVGKDSEATRVYSPDGNARTIKNGGGMGAKTGLYAVENNKIKRKGGMYGQSTRWGLYDETGLSPTVTSAMGEGGGHVPMVEAKPKTFRRRRTEDGKKQRKENMKQGNDTTPFGSKEVVAEESDIMPTLTAGENVENNIMENTRIRRLTPVECSRLQGFPDTWTEKGNYDGAVREVSDTQRYKVLGNAVSCPVVEAIGKRLLTEIEEQQ